MYCNWYSTTGDQLSTVHASSGALSLTCTYDDSGWAGEPVTAKKQYLRFISKFRYAANVIQ